MKAFFDFSVIIALSVFFLVFIISSLVVVNEPPENGFYHERFEIGEFKNQEEDYEIEIDLKTGKKILRPIKTKIQQQEEDGKIRGPIPFFDDVMLCANQTRAFKNL